MPAERSTAVTVFFDFDNTLMDNDAVGQRFRDRLTAEMGPAPAGRFWEIYEQVRAQSGIVDIPEAIRRFAAAGDKAIDSDRLRAIFFQFPFAKLVYPDAPSALAHAEAIGGRPVVLSDGDREYQPRKIRASGIDELVGGRVRVYAHKEEHAEELMRDFPSRHYVMVDDKPRIHAAMRNAFGDLMTTVMVCQGKYAHDPAHHDFPEADIVIEGIGGLSELDANDLTRRRGHSRGRP